MNLYRLAVIALRVWSIDLMLGGLINLLNLPVPIMDLLASTNNYHEQWNLVRVGGGILYSVLHLGVGIYLMDHPEPTARFVTRSIHYVVARVAPQGNVWPPAPTLPAESENTPVPLVSASIFQVAVIILRVEGIEWIFGLGYILQDIALQAFGLAHNSSGYWHGFYLLELCMNVPHCLGEIAIGLYFLFSPQALANRITLDLVHDDDSEPQAPVGPLESVGNIEANVTH